VAVPERPHRWQLADAPAGWAAAAGGDHAIAAATKRSESATLAASSVAGEAGRPGGEGPRPRGGEGAPAVGTTTATETSSLVASKVELWPSKPRNLNPIL
jgi:hypothetical protein